MFLALSIGAMTIILWVLLRSNKKPIQTNYNHCTCSLFHVDISMPWSMVKKIGAMEWSMVCCQWNMATWYYHGFIRSKRCHWMNLYLLLIVKWMRLESVEMHKSLAHILNGGPGLLRPKEQWSAKIKDKSKSEWIQVNRCKEGKSIKVSQTKNTELPLIPGFAFAFFHPPAGQGK